MGYRSPRALLAAARAWRREQPEAWGRFVETAYQQQRETGRVSVPCVFEAMRARERQEGHPGRFGLDNSLRPALARILAQEEPMLAPYVEMRDSAVDSVLAFEELELEGGAR